MMFGSYLLGEMMYSLIAPYMWWQGGGVICKLSTLKLFLTILKKSNIGRPGKSNILSSRRKFRALKFPHDNVNSNRDRPPICTLNVDKMLNCSAWLRLKLNTKMGLNHHTTPHYTTPHHQELLGNF